MLEEKYPACGFVQSAKSTSGKCSVTSASRFKEQTDLSYASQYEKKSGSTFVSNTVNTSTVDLQTS